MTSQQQQFIYFSKSGKPTLVPPDDLFDWVAQRAAENVCARLQRNIVDANDIHAQFDVSRCLWGHSPTSAASWIADQYYQHVFASRGSSS